jgi:hypothetical protein
MSGEGGPNGRSGSPRPRTPGRPGRGGRSDGFEPRAPGHSGEPVAHQARPTSDPRDREQRPDAADAAPRGMERLSDLLPRAAREFGLEDQLEQAQAAAAWDRIVAERVPAAVGSCRLAGLSQGVATIEIDLPIVAQEIRLRSPELLAALRRTVRTPIRQLHLTTRHV